MNICKDCFCVLRNREILYIDEKYIIHSNTEFKEILQNIKNNDYDSIIKMENIIWNLRKLFYKKKIKITFKSSNNLIL